MTEKYTNLITLDFETYYGQEYTLSKMSTSEYIRDPRFKAQMVGIKVNDEGTKVYAASQVEKALRSIDWESSALLCHNTAFDGFILNEHYGIKPRYYYDTLSMARGLHSNEIGAKLDDVAQYYGKGNKLQDVLEQTKDILDWPADLTRKVAMYCKQDVDLTYEIFKEMLEKYPQKELDLINLTCRVFCQPILRLDIQRIQEEYERETKERAELSLRAVDVSREEYAAVLKGKEKKLTGQERDELIAKRVLGSGERFAQLLHEEGIKAPMKISPSWEAKPVAERDDSKQYTYAFAKNDLEFIGLPQDVDLLGKGLDLDTEEGAVKLAEKQQRIQTLVDARLAIKSSTNITRAERFLKAGENGALLPVGYAYYRAHTGRFGGTNKMNMQNLPRGGELRRSILAQPDHMLAVCDSGQIEVRVNAWLWGQTDLIELFKQKKDPYCDFGTTVYGRVITKADETERHIAKTAVLGLGYGMGAKQFQFALATGFGGKRINLTAQESQRIVTAYRTRNNRIVRGWNYCNNIIADMAAGRTGKYKCITWGKDHIRLPNGMALKYPDLKMTQSDEGESYWSYRNKDGRTKIYSSKLTENIVQALARIIVMGQMLDIDELYLVVMTTHDEVVSHVQKEQAEECFAYMSKCMAKPPEWCADLPLSSDGGVAENYSK